MHDRCPDSGLLGRRHWITRFTADQPSTQFGSLGVPEVSRVGVELDRKLAELLQVLDVEVPEALLQS